MSNAIFVTDFLLARHEELIPVYDRLGKKDYADRELAKVAWLKELRLKQTKTPIQLTLF